MDTRSKLPEIITEAFNGRLSEGQRRMAGEIWKNRVKRVVALVGEDLIEQMHNEPFLLNDENKAIHPGQLLINVLANGGEILVGRDERGIIGVQVLDEIRMGHKAIWHLWVVPGRRRTKAMKSFILEGLAYAFTQPPEGLGLYKVTMMSCNREALVPAEKWLGFQFAGLLQYEAFYNGVLSSIMVLERYNPALEVGTDGQHGRTNGRVRQPEQGLNVEQPVCAGLPDTTDGLRTIEPGIESGMAGTVEHVHADSGANVHVLKRAESNTKGKVSSRSRRRRKRR